MWLQPHVDWPGRVSLESARVHVRRERVFLWLAAIIVAGATLLPLLGLSKVFGVSWFVRQVGIEPPVMLLVPLGAIALPLALLAWNLVGELFGAARARSLVLVVLVLWVGVLGLSWVTDHVADYDNRVTTAFGTALVLVGAGLVTLIVQVALFAWIGPRWLRHLAAPVIALAIGWTAFALALAHLAIPGAPAPSEILGIALGAGGYAALVVVIGALPVVLLARGLTIYLRVVPRGTATPDTEDDGEPAFVAKNRPFTRDELAFFDAGDRDADEHSAHAS